MTSEKDVKGANVGMGCEKKVQEPACTRREGSRTDFSPGEAGGTDGRTSAFAAASAGQASVRTLQKTMSVRQGCLTYFASAFAKAATARRGACFFACSGWIGGGEYKAKNLILKGSV